MREYGRDETFKDYAKVIYHDKWVGGALHYTGMGKNGDQVQRIK